ncbi:hypothetical protein GDO81_023631 [Engystomops pustulosus]|uniref:Uncharacterized protein n=1 Tax=Engystomops pustulosus TaxID=76066 RepID=A0AAV6YSK1_ENGPU|nr:hypothetical protein GDO81_023631 [Engystomops pustulosus]
MYFAAFAFNIIYILENTIIIVSEPHIYVMCHNKYIWKVIQWFHSYEGHIHPPYIQLPHHNLCLTIFTHYFLYSMTPIHQHLISYPWDLPSKSGLKHSSPKTQVLQQN